MAQISREDVQRRFDRITEIFADIVVRADAQAATRCPYRDRHDACTAKFACRNQRPAHAEDLRCGHDGAFDYRDAWESDPRTAEVARDRLQRVRDAAGQRRADRERDAGGGP